MLRELQGVSYIPAKCHKVRSTNGFKLDRHFLPTLWKFCFLRHCQASQTVISKQNSITLCQTADGKSSGGSRGVRWVRTNPPLAGSGCGGWKRLNWLCQSSSLRDIFTETVHSLIWQHEYIEGSIRQAIIQLYFIYNPPKWWWWLGNSRRWSSPPDGQRWGPTGQALRCRRTP